MEFKDRIRLLRKEAGLTQREAADRIGVTYRTYQNYEAGASLPSGTVLARISSLFGVSMDLLTDKTDTKIKAAEDPALRALLEEMQALFSGGKLRDEDKQYVIDALTEAFWLSKERNKKYGKRKEK